MAMNKELLSRAENQCELCGTKETLQSYMVVPEIGDSIDETACLCSNCVDQIEKPDQIDINHWR